MKEIPKPAHSTWTDEQWHAITARGQDILVAAAAGSGKTAVLVERIIKRITDKDDPVDVDRLLIVTFTNAAAAEMKKRIGEALEQEMTKQPDSIYLKKQLSLLNRASISTLHSFCLEVLRRHYYKLDLDPKFRIADDTEAVLLREEIVEELFEEQYSRADHDAFYHLVDCFSSDRSDLDLQRLVLKLYDFSRSYPSPEEWLEQMAVRYGGAEEQGIDVNADIWTKELIADIRLQIQGMLGLIEQALDITREPAGPAPYAENLDQVKLHLERLLQASLPSSQPSWDRLYLAFQELDFGKLKPCRGDSYDKALQEKVKSLREQVKKHVSGIQEELFNRPLAEYIHDIRQMAPLMYMLVELIKDFSRRYAKQKREKALVDFADLEHYSLEILREEEISFAYKKHFVEVLVDEYQDTNLVQESIIQLVSKDEPESGNLFMVGDVKQSIYRFRQAEPGLFLSKYKRFAEQDSPGIRIDLARNFRSRAEVLDGTNYLFKQVMNEAVGEIEYDQDAELKLGASYPTSDQMSVELMLVERSSSPEDHESFNDHSVERQYDGSDGEANGDEGEEYSESDRIGRGQEGIDRTDLETVQLEAKLMAQKIKELMGHGGKDPFQIYNQKLHLLRPIQYRDIVILLRATSTWAPAILEEFKKQGIPAYADLSTGYFSATEVAIMMSLLKIIDNPYQDIPLASVLRSPILGLDEEEMAQIRISKQDGSFYEAVRSLIHSAQDSLLAGTLTSFLEQLDSWRTKARQGSLSELIWQLYRETGYYDFVGGMPGGNQRQANLRALYDRARQYEATSFRGLFRFLRFIERMQDLGRDLGTARALGEQEDVVRLMTIHKSKGLEFPVVFIAGVNKQFNRQDLNQRFLMHKELGFGSKFIDPLKRISYPMLPQLTIRRRMHMELLAEEMRVLYVALTRAKEKLYLIGTVKDAEKLIEKWEAPLSYREWMLPDYDRVKAKTYLDWIGPSVMRHQHAGVLRKTNSSQFKGLGEDIFGHPSRWSVCCVDSASLLEVDTVVEQFHEAIEAALKEGKKVPIFSEHNEKVEKALTWEYPHPLAEEHKAKQSVTELKRQKEWMNADGVPLLASHKRQPIVDRPRFLHASKLTAAERGTAMHMVMQHLPMNRQLKVDEIQDFVAHMVEQELLTYEQAEEIHVESIFHFIQSELGQRVRNGRSLHREVPFSYGMPACDAFAHWKKQVDRELSTEQEIVLIQGVIDCLLEEEDGLVLIDYKTDAIQGRYRSLEEVERVMRERYQLQLRLYARAIEEIWKQPVKEKYLYLFDGGQIVQLDL